MYDDNDELENYGECAYFIARAYTSEYFEIFIFFLLLLPDVFVFFVRRFLSFFPISFGGLLLFSRVQYKLFAVSSSETTKQYIGDDRCTIAHLYEKWIRKRAIFFCIFQLHITHQSANGMERWKLNTYKIQWTLDSAVPAIRRAYHVFKWKISCTFQLRCTALTREEKVNFFLCWFDKNSIVFL